MDSFKLRLNGFYVAADGNYGSGQFVVFGANNLTAKQLETMDNLSDGDRYDYAAAIAYGLNDLTEWENN